VILGREIKVLLFNKETSTFLHNCITLPVTWRNQYEDRWYPSTDPEESSFFIKLKDPPSENLVLVFEFVIHINRRKKPLEISCGYAMIELQKISKNSTEKYNLLIEGGNPTKKLKIRNEDIKARRTGWRNVVKKLTGAIQSKLTIECIPDKKIKPSLRVS
jgi:hypothetical protein